MYKHDVYRKYTLLTIRPQQSAKKGIHDDPLFRKMHGYSDDWDMFATRAFSWSNYMLAISWNDEVVVDDKTAKFYALLSGNCPR